MNKVFYFYGCSQTAGDELSDGTEQFPFKLTDSLEDYFKVKLSALPTQHEYHIYEECNKKFAYPAMITKKYNIPTLNFASNGKSLRHNILDIIKHVSLESEKIAHIFLQVPVTGREVYINERRINSVQLNNLNNPYTPLNEYIKSKVISHPDIHFIAEDIFDLILLDGFLKSKNISYTLIDFHYNLSEFRFKELTNTHLDWTTGFKPTLPIWKLIFPHGELQSIGFHFTHYGHEYIADIIKVQIIDKL